MSTTNKSMLETMLEAGVHFGHQTKFWNPGMKPYIFGARSKIHIINLDKTVALFQEALKFTQQVVKNKGSVLFVGTRSQAGEIIAEEAIRAGMPYVNQRWLGGMLTNFETVKKSIKKLEIKQGLLDKSGENGLSKKELLDLSREINKLQSSIGGIVEMKSLPSALFVIDTGCHDIAIKEAKKLGIPVIGIVDTNNDPSAIDYVVPGNDDSAKAIRLYASTVADAIIKAKDTIITNLVAESKLEMVEDNSESRQKTVRRVKNAKSNEIEDSSSVRDNDQKNDDYQNSGQKNDDNQKSDANQTEETGS
ncbi:MAG: small subunit ribosomal protein [Pseudomonadota bacterium]|nr:small subunit ribosomal protein [Pseudomonadota bacterium]